MKVRAHASGVISVCNKAIDRSNNGSIDRQISQPALDDRELDGRKLDGRELDGQSAMIAGLLR